jgi:ABC-2 type transport system permease protein
MNGFAVFLRKELREAWRTARLPVVVGIFFIFGALSPVLAKYTPEILKSLGGGVQIIVPPPQAADAVDQFLKNVAGNGIFVAILLTMGLVAREKERGTAAFALAKPLTRPAFLVAKLVALLLTLGVGIAVAGAATYVYTAMLFSSLSVPGFMGCCALVLLMLSAYAAPTFLGSTLVRSQLPAAGLGIAAWLIIAILGALPKVGEYTPSALLESARAVALGMQPQHLGTALLGTLGLIVAALLLAWLSFRSQELPAAA